MGGLLERAAEQAAVQEALADVRSGTGASLLVAGPAGIGKSSVLAWARDLARTSGFVVLGSSPTPVSTTLAHTVVRDWLGPLVHEHPPGSLPFDGPATDLAEALTGSSAAHQVWNLATVDFALTWVLENLTAAGPALLVVDDLQWADQASLQVLDLLSARLHALPVMLVLALRSGETSVFQDVVDRITVRSRRLDLAPLSLAGVHQLREQVGSSPALSEVSDEDLLGHTGGVPFLLRELLRSDSADHPPGGVVESVRERLARLGDPAETLARAAAVLGEQADFEALSAVTGLGAAELADPLALLTWAGLLSRGSRRAEIAHPLVGEAVLSSMTPSQRSSLHHRAADHLRRLGAPLSMVAGHLVHTLPSHSPAVVAELRAAGEEALAAGAPDIGARLLMRAVDETRREETDLDLLATTATAHLRAGRSEEAFDLWAKALDRANDPVHKARLHADIGAVQMNIGERSAAARSYELAVRELSQAGHHASSPEMREVLVRVGFTRALYGGDRTDLSGAVSEAARQPVEKDTPTDRLLFVLAASDHAIRGEDLPSCRALALRALGRGSLLAEETFEGIGFYVALGALSWVDAYAESLEALDEAVAETRRAGSVLGFATASYTRGLVHHRRGRLRLALGDFQPALELRARGWPTFAEPALGGITLTYLGLGQEQQALSFEPYLRAAAARGQFLSAMPLATAGVLRAVQGDHEQALADYRAAGALMGSHPDNPSIVPWRALSAWSLRALGREDEAREVAEVALGNARHWGAPRALGFSLRTLAQLTPRTESLTLLREAVSELEKVDSVDYRARSRADLAALLIEGTDSERTEGIAMLHECLAYGLQAQVPSVAQRAAALLRGAGEEVEAVLDPVASLTPGERRVVDLAIVGDTNRQIAQQLFVTVKAVEWHLSNAYRKLGISSRADLETAVYGETRPSSSSDM